MADVDAHGEHRVFFDDDAFDHFGAGADEAVVFDDGGVGLHGLQHAANTNAAAQVHVFANLGAGTDRSPGVDHGAFIDISADVDKRGHQNHALGQVAAAARHGGGHHANAGGFHAGFGHARKFGRYFVIKAQLTGFHEFVIFQAKAQQHGFFDPLVHGPLAHGLAGGDAQVARVELGNDVLDGVQQFRGGIGHGDVGAVFPGGVEDGLELLGHGEVS